ncbi:MAG: hypothetical protein ACHQO8_12865, partial [Vicinamibacterales bacterium]
MSRAERGQATTEYLMISGLITAMGIVVLGFMQTPLRESLQKVTEYVLGQALNPPYDSGDDGGGGGGGFGGGGGRG